MMFDFTDLKVEVRDENTKLRSDMKEAITKLRSDMKDENNNLRMEMKDLGVGLMHEIKNAIGNMRAEIKDSNDKNTQRMDAIINTSHLLISANNSRIDEAQKEFSAMQSSLKDLNLNLQTILKDLHGHQKKA